MIEQELVVIPGDGVGREVIPLAVPLLHRLRPDVRLHYAEAGRDHARRTGDPLDADTVDRIRTVGSALIGPLASEPPRHAAFPPLQRGLDLFASLQRFSLAERARPMLLLSPVRAPEARADESLPLDLWNATRLGNEVERLLDMNGAASMTIVHEGWPAFVQAVQGGLPDGVDAEPLEVTTLLAEWEARAPSLSLVVASDAASELLLGRLAARTPAGSGASLLFGDRVTLAMPRHGPLDDEVEWGFSNPLGVINALEMLLRYVWQYTEAADQLRGAVDRALTRRRPPQHGGLHTMYEVHRAILRALEEG